MRMPEQFEPSTAVNSSELSPQRLPASPGRRRLGTLLFIVALGLVIFFGYKVFSYYQKIQAGTLDPSTYSFSSTLAAQSHLIDIAKEAPGSGMLATADDPSMGPADAKLTIVQFADFGCPYSAQESYVVRAIAQQYPDDVRIIYRDFPIVELHPGADLAAQAGSCAHEQGKFWEYHDLLYRNSGDFTEDALIDYATRVGVNMRTFQACLQSGKYEEEVIQDMSDAVTAGVVGTPTFYFNGEIVSGAIPFGIFDDIVKAFLSE